MRISPAGRATMRRITLPLLVMLSIAMIIIGKADQMVVESAANWLMDATAPTLEMLSRPAAALDVAVDRARGFVTVYEENARLKEENERLLGWQQAALKLSSENAQLRDLLKLAPGPEISYVTARVIADSGGAYARSVIIDAGRENGVARGQAAVTGNGLVGRISETGRRAARVLLITDLNSRVPVIVDGVGQRAILVGDNSERPSLRYMEEGATVRIGDKIVTSGQGGVFPPGLPVGVVAGFDSGVPRVEAYAALTRVDYLRLLDYGLANALPNPLPLAPRVSKRTEPLVGATTARR